MSSIKYLLALAVVATLASSAFAVHCYQCGSVTTKKCGDPFEAEDNMKADCNPAPGLLDHVSKVIGVNTNATGCMKQTVELPMGGGTHIVRACYFGDIKNTSGGCKLDVASLTGTKLGSCEVCTGDLCNNSPSLAPIAATIVTFFGLAHIFS